MILTGENRSTGRKNVPVPLCLLKIQHGLTWNRTRLFAVADQRVTTQDRHRERERERERENVCVCTHSRGGKGVIW
jgi:hypothetical protein